MDDDRRVEAERISGLEVREHATERTVRAIHRDVVVVEVASGAGDGA